ncbi:MAG TPA: carboxypeptidase-like regulatory domain-containing protein, partial [Allocoleopsis sp.]
MTCGTDSNKDCTLQSFERNRYFYSKLLTVSDFEIEQRYGINKDRLIHRLLHGHGISYGIEVTDITLNSQNNLAVKLTEGAALDCCGNEIIVPNRANAIELKNTPALADGATYYLYLEYAECLKDPMPQLVNGSSCEESCCYSRIQETFTLSVAKAPDTIISGKVVTQGTLTGIEDAKVVAFNTDGNIQGTAITNAAGDYQLPVLNNQAYDIKASASGYQSKTQRLSASVTQNIELVKTTPDCQASTENYAEAQLKTKPQCTDPKVLIAVFTVTANTPKKDDNQTKALRSYIYSNPMLHDLLCDHIGDLDNPHETTAAQVGALQSVNGVGNVSGQPYTSNIDLVSLDNKIRISPPDSPPSGVSLTNTQINLSLEDGAIDRRHLSSDVINNLITSNGTITITRTNNAGDDKEIGLSTSALQLGAMVSVNGVQNVNGNVSLQSPDTSILINSAAGAGVLGLTVNPGTNILSVRTAPAPGTAAKFAREDHVHNLADGVVTSAKIQAGA